MIKFCSDIYDMYCPVEEIIDNGFALAVFNYEDVTTDNDDFSNGIAGMFDREENSGWGKISMWAYAASRAVDYLLTRDETDSNKKGTNFTVRSFCALFSKNCVFKVAVFIFALHICFKCA